MVSGVANRRKNGLPVTQMLFLERIKDGLPAVAAAEATPTLSAPALPHHLLAIFDIHSPCRVGLNHLLNHHNDRCTLQEYGAAP